MRYGSGNCSGSRAAGDGVQPEVRQHELLERPGEPALVVNEPRRLAGEIGRHPALEHVGRLDDVIIDRDQQVGGFARFGVG